MTHTSIAGFEDSPAVLERTENGHRIEDWKAGSARLDQCWRDHRPRALCRWSRYWQSIDRDRQMTADKLYNIAKDSASGCPSMPVNSWLTHQTVRRTPGLLPNSRPIRPS